MKTKGLVLIHPGPGDPPFQCCGGFLPSTPHHGSLSWIIDNFIDMCAIRWIYCMKSLSIHC